MSNLLRRRQRVSSEHLIHGGRRINICSMKPAHHNLSRTEESLIRTRVHDEVQTMKVHCGYLFCLFVGLCAELAAGRALPTDRTDTTDPDMQSIIEDLQAALRSYDSILNETSFLRNLPVPPCTETAAHLEQSSMVVLRLAKYQGCVQQLQSFSPDVSALCRVVTLNKDLLQHLKGSYQDSAGCPSSSSSSPASDFDSIRKSIQCVHCWSQQVAALRR